MSKVARDESAREAEASEGLASFADRYLATNESSQATVWRAYDSGFSGILVCLFVYFPNHLLITRNVVPLIPLFVLL